MESLPIDRHLDEIVTALRKTGSLVLTAPPGSGKTTRIPRALLDAGFAENGEILILEPRRLAARMAAARVAEELGETPGKTVGYSIRFENAGGPETRVRFLTEAILTRRIARDPALNGVSTVILDEFHERHLETDIAIALLKRAQTLRPGLKILVMSATLDARPVAEYLTGAAAISFSESPHDIEIEYEEKPDSRPLHEKIASGITKLLRAGIQGDILVFLPGAAEIRRASETLQGISKNSGFETFILHGDLPAAEQRKALSPSAVTKVILSTNVAETSITIPGIAAVIDCGLARVAGHSAWSGFPTLTTAKISKSSATQRAGRAGRTQSGRVLRLYSKIDFNARPDREKPEILRADLAETVLMLRGAGIRNPSEFDWFERPSDPAIDAAEELLKKLGAVDENGGLTKNGERMLTLPVHPRIARLMIAGEELRVTEESGLLAALISERDIRARGKIGETDGGAQHVGLSDLLELLDRFHEAETVDFQADRLRAMGLDSGAVYAIRQAWRQLRRLYRRDAPASNRTDSINKSRSSQNGSDTRSNEETEEALRMAVLKAFPDRVARRRRAGSRELLLAGGGEAKLSPASVVQESTFIVAVDIEEKKESAAFRSTNTLIRLASAIEIEWLAEFFPEKIQETTELLWNETAERVEEYRRALYDGLTLEETARPAPISEETARILADAVIARGLALLPGFGEIETLRARLELLRQTFPEDDWPIIGEREIREAIRELCRNYRGFKEIAGISIYEALMAGLPDKQRARLDREAPERIALTPKRSVRIHYEQNRPPWIESRLQDFFGVRETPRVCAGRTPLTLHLLAPNQRAVQVTRDLAGFWTRHYPAIRRELMRRYPKHAWPEKVSD